MHVQSYCFRTEGTAHPDPGRTQAIDLCAPEETVSNQGGI